ncbi:MAG: ThuA domain-containing protein [Phycisphaerae bacterium]|nr:ThuA domain-containing protein [Phycisphaerae bacterium]
MEELRASPGRHSRTLNRSPAALLCLAGLVVLSACGVGLCKGRVLIYTKNGKGYVHDNIPASVDCLKEICAANGWTCEVSDSAAVFTAEKIQGFDVLVFSNTNNETFDSNDQRQVFQGYIRGGGGFVGIHSACGSERDWPWFWANLGGKFVRHPPLQRFDIKVIDPGHASTRFLPPVWKWEDECYYMNHLNPDIRVLLAVDLTTIQDDQKKVYPGEVFGQVFPLCWYHEFDGGRQWYTALGHQIGHYKDENFKKHLAAGIAWAMRRTTP